MADILFKKPDGSFVTVDSSEAEAAQSMGYVPTTREAMKAPEQSSGRAFIEGAGRGATLGLTDYLLPGYEAALAGGTVAEAKAGMQARRTQAPVAAGLGEAAGAVGTSLLTGGGISTLAGAGIKGAAVESGIYGLSTAFTENALEDKEILAESLAARAAGGALAGAGVAGVLKGVGAGASAVMKKVGGGALADTLKKVGRDAEWRALAESNKTWADRNKAFKDQILDFAYEKGILGQASSALDATTAAKATALSESYAQRIAEGMAELEGYVPLKGNKELRQEFADYLQSKLKSQFGKSPAHEEALKSAQKYVESIAKEDRTWSEAWNVQSTLFKERVPDTASGEIREELRQAMRNFVFDEVASGKNKAGKILAGVTPRGKIPERMKLEGEAFTSASAEAVVPGDLPPAPFTVRLSGDVPEVRGGGAFDIPTVETVRTLEMPNPDFAPRPFPTPGSDALTVRLGEEPAAAMLFDVPGAERIVGAAPSPLPAQGRVQLPVPARTVRLGEPETVAGLRFTPEAATVRLGEGADEIAGGLVVDLPAKQTPAWFGAQLRQTGREARMAQSLAKALNTRAQSIESSGGLLGLGSLKSLGAGAVFGLSTGSLPAAVGGAVLEQQLRKRGGLLTGAALRALAESKVTSGAAKVLQGRVSQALSLAPEILGAYAYPLAKASALGADELMTEYVRLASQPGGEQLTSLLGLERESPEQVAEAGQRISLLDTIQAAADEQRELMASAAEGLLGAARGRPTSLKPSILTAKDFNKVQESIRGALVQPEKLFEMDPEVQAIAPATASMTAATLLRGAQFLDSKAPKSPYEGMPASVAPQWQPSQAELDRFNRYREAVMDPARVLKNMANGYHSPEQVEAMKAVYPRLYSELQQKLGERLSEIKKPLTYQQKMSLSLIMGPTALGMSQQQIQILQQAQSSVPQQAGGMTKPDGRQAVDAQRNQMTQAQRLESRGTK